VSAPHVDVSVIVSAHELRREIPRTVHSLAPPYQVGLDGTSVEIIVADNGSTVPVDAAWFAPTQAHVRVMRFPPGDPSPCAALNAAAASARGAALAVLIDGARIASPGLLSRALRAMRTGDDVFVATMGFHLGPQQQQASQLSGYSAEAEDRLLDGIAWPRDGYRLFEIAARAGSHRRGVLSDFPETTAFVMRRTTFARIGGFDERFRYRGGGLANFAFYDRVMCDASIEPVVLVGEGTFHQVHDGNTTRAGGVGRRETPDGPTIWEAMVDEFRTITGREPLAAQHLRPLLFGRCESADAERLFFAPPEAAAAPPPA